MLKLRWSFMIITLHLSCNLWYAHWCSNKYFTAQTKDQIFSRVMFVTGSILCAQPFPRAFWHARQQACYLTDTALCKFSHPKINHHPISSLSPFSPASLNLLNMISTTISPRFCSPLPPIFQSNLVLNHYTSLYWNCSEQGCSLIIQMDKSQTLCPILHPLWAFDCT